MAIVSLGAHTTTHSGLVIPNAVDAPVPNLAEPDAVDFNLVGNDRYGVVNGCDISVNTTSIEVTAGVVVINGQIVRFITPNSVPIANQDTPRFGLVWIDTSGSLGITYGERSTNPVYPDLASTQVAIAGVYTNATITDFAGYVVDKRNILASTFVSTKSGTQPVLQNLNNGSSTFLLDASGKMTWASDTNLSRNAANSLHFDGNLYVDKSVVAQVDLQAAGKVDAAGTVTGSNLIRAAVAPTSAPNGTLLQNTTTGSVYLRRNNVWDEIVTASSFLPVGTVIQSMVALTESQGWMPVDGGRVYQSQKTALYNALVATGFAIETDVVGNYVTLPDAQAQGGAFLRNGGSFAFNGSPAGGNTSRQLSESNIPAHKHDVQLIGDGSHNHVLTLQEAGSHSHDMLSGGGVHLHSIVDPGHSHDADASNSNIKFIFDNARKTGAQGRLDPVATDSSHTAYTRSQRTTGTASTNILTTAENDPASRHTHQIGPSGQHTHNATAAFNGHTHTISENTVGAGQAFSLLPPFITVRTYIRF